MIFGVFDHEYGWGTLLPHSHHLVEGHRRGGRSTGTSPSQRVGHRVQPRLSGHLGAHLHAEISITREQQ